MDDDQGDDDRRGGLDGPGADADLGIENGTSLPLPFICLYDTTFSVKGQTVPDFSRQKQGPQRMLAALSLLKKAAPKGPLAKGGWHGESRDWGGAAECSEFAENQCEIVTFHCESLRPR